MRPIFHSVISGAMRGIRHRDHLLPTLIWFSYDARNANFDLAPLLLFGRLSKLPSAHKYKLRLCETRYSTLFKCLLGDNPYTIFFHQSSFSHQTSLNLFSQWQSMVVVGWMDGRAYCVQLSKHGEWYIQAAALLRTVRQGNSTENVLLSVVVVLLLTAFFTIDESERL